MFIFAAVFSSSATVYGSAPVPIIETSTVGVGITNPYGRTKYFLEEVETSCFPLWLIDLRVDSPRCGEG